MTHTGLPHARILMGSFLLSLSFLPACSAPRHKIEPARKNINGPTQAAFRDRSEQIRRDPLAYLEEVLQNCRRLEQYSVNFTRQERRGLAFFKRLHEPELIQCKFRREPFSVYMKWLDPEVKYGESTFVAGRENDKVRFIPRNGLFGLPPTLQRVELQTPVIWGEARYPMTEFGLERMMEHTFETIRAAGAECATVYEGVTRLADSDRPVHFIRFELPSRLFEAPIRELYIDAETDLPVCTRIVFASGKLEAAYVWADVNPDVHFTDDDFVLDAERNSNAVAETTPSKQ